MGAEVAEVVAVVPGMQVVHVEIADEARATQCNFKAQAGDPSSIYGIIRCLSHYCSVAASVD